MATSCVGQLDFRCRVSLILLHLRVQCEFRRPWREQSTTARFQSTRPSARKVLLVRRVEMSSPPPAPTTAAERLATCSAYLAEFWREESRAYKRIGNQLHAEAADNDVRIKSDETIAGIPALQARRLMGILAGSNFTPALTSKMLGCSRPEAQRALRRLCEEGYLSECDVGTWAATVKGVALAGATAAKPLRRGTVERLISELLHRVREVNRDDRWAYKVKAVAVFGSVLTKEQRPNDVDVAFSLCPRWRDEEQQRRHEEERRSLRKSPFPNTIAWAYWPELEVLRFLKSRSRGLSIHMFDDWIRENTTWRIIYGARRTGARKLKTDQ